MFSVKPFAAAPFSTGADLGDVSVDLLGLVATASVSSVQVQTASPDVTVDLNGVSATTSIGDTAISTSVNTSVTGVASSAQVTEVLSTGTAAVSITGVTASGQIGQAVGSISLDVLVSGVQGVGQVVEEPHEFNLKYASYANKSLDINRSGYTDYFTGRSRATSVLPTGDKVMFSMRTGSEFGSTVFNLGTNWDISTGVYSSNYDIDAQIADNVDQYLYYAFSYGGTPTPLWFMIDEPDERLYLFSGVGGTNYNLATLITPRQSASTAYKGLAVRQPTNDRAKTNVYIGIGGYIYQIDNVAFFGTNTVQYNGKYLDLFNGTNWPASGVVKSYEGISISSDGSILYVLINGIVNSVYGYWVVELALETAWDISTATYIGNPINISAGASINTTTYSQSPNTLSWKPDGTKFYFSVDTLTTNVVAKAYQYDISPTTATVAVSAQTNLFVNGVSASGSVGTVTVIAQENDQVNLTGVQSSAFIGTAVADATGTVNVSVTGVQGLGQVVAVTVATTDGAQVLVVGVAATGSIGTAAVIQGIDAPVTGVQGNADVGTVAVDATDNIEILMVGVQANGAVSDVAISGQANIYPNGIQATGQVSTVDVSISEDALATGVEGNGFIGQVNVGEGVGVDVTGVEANGEVGQIEHAASVDVSLTGVVATALVNGVTIAAAGNISFDVTGVHGTGEIGQANVDASANASATGVFASGEVGSVEVDLALQVFLTGVEGTGEIGDVQVLAVENVVVPVTGVFATAELAEATAQTDIAVAAQGYSVSALTARSGLFQAYSDAKLSTARAKFGVSSLLLDGGLDYVGPTENNVWGSGDFTVEFWSYRTTNPASNQVLFDCRTATNNGLLIFVDSIGRLNLVVNGGAGGTFATGTSSGVWNAAAIVRESGILSFYINGTRLGTVANSNNYSGRKFALGAVGPVNPGTLGYNGNIDEFRTSTVARYSGTTYTLATTEFNSDNATQDLLHFDGANNSTQMVNSSTANWRVVAIGDANTLVSGVFGTGEIGTPIAGAVTVVTLTGVEGTGEVGAAVASISESFTAGSVEGIGEIGSVAVSAAANALATGVEATGQTGDVTVNTFSPAEVTGVFGTGQIGTLAVAANADVFAVGSSATGQVGNVTVQLAIDVPVTGVQGLGQVGTATAVVDAQGVVTGVFGSASVGTATVTNSSNVITTGVSAAGSVGQVTSSGVTAVFVTGLQAAGFIGTVSYSGTTNVQALVTGVSARGEAGDLSGWTNISDDQTPGWFPDPDAGGSSWTPVTDSQESSWFPIAA